jgi:hypothetical protein
VIESIKGATDNTVVDNIISDAITSGDIIFDISAYPLLTEANPNNIEAKMPHLTGLTVPLSTQYELLARGEHLGNSLEDKIPTNVIIG